MGNDEYPTVLAADAVDAGELLREADLPPGQCRWVTPTSGFASRHGQAPPLRKSRKQAGSPSAMSAPSWARTARSGEPAGPGAD